ncbi:MAG: BatA domain-containing protein, partial [Planctomycetota bacterium]|nr:BatA domain-containing protein [Planctomycetota bacterium]
MPSFDFQSLLWWGLPVVAAPIVIHLINLLRHRRVTWAAMEFLLASQRKYKTRVLLKQLLLLLMRVAAVLGIVLALAGPRWSNSLAGILGGGRTAHVILLDDSFSMGDSSGNGETDETMTAWDRGRGVVERIVSDLAMTAGRQELAIGRFAGLTLPTTSGASPRFDRPLELVTPGVVQEVRDLLAAMRVSATDCGPREPLAA